jgi:phosphatidylinositol glycan class T
MKVLHCVVSAFVAAHYSETLELEQFEDGKVFAAFSFKRVISDYETNHFHLFPKAIGEIFQKFKTKSLSLSFTSGQWNVERFGYSKYQKPKGTTLLAHLENEK